MVADRRFAMAIVLISTLGCANPMDWEPQGTVSWVQWRETTESGSKSGEATCSLLNTGKVAFSVVDLALTLKTDSDVYHLQAHLSVELTPGKLAYSTISFPYRAPSETAGLANLSIDSTSFH